MAKLKVTPELLASVLFPDTYGIEIHNATFAYPYIELEITGPRIPDVERVTCHIKKQPALTFEFNPDD